jgi:hypothetical protein
MTTASRSILPAFLLALLLAAPSAPAEAQSTPAHPASTASADEVAAEADWFGSRIKFRGYHLFDDWSTVRTDDYGAGGKAGFGAGIELVLPSGIGLGMTAFTRGGQISEFDLEASDLVVTAEANYFLRIRPLRLAPFVGVHGGVLSQSQGERGDLGWHDGFDELGYQYGVRFQPFALIGIDLQVRHNSGYAGRAHGVDREVLLGMTLF